MTISYTGNTENSEIHVRDLNLTYRIKRRKKEATGSQVALRDVNLDVRKGEFLSLVGPSGCGKSTFLYILAGLIQRTSGDVSINGNEVIGPGLDRGIVMQGYALFPWRTILRNVEFGLEMKGTPKKDRRETALRCIEMVGLKGYEGRYPYELSGGMKQRIAIARVLAYNPDVLLMDEPFAAVDEQTRNALHEELLRIWTETKKTIIFVTHSIDEAIFLSDRIAVMTAGPGRIKSIVPIDLDRPRPASVRTSPEFSTYRHKVWQLLQTRSDMVKDVKIEKHILEEFPQENAI
ncbi:MAG: ABC transporter ATP-binding protein [Clostridiales Family XIII bacterium]|jgi:NitT/TauT family transport system ATP-binding protein|nr:ABC transporter ATP-binding protein [Clostridiales Family XIII bacterium]